MPIVDVRDVAAAHIAAAYDPAAHGRYLLVGSNTNLIDMGQVLAEKYPPPQYPVASKAISVPKFLLWLLAPYLPGPPMTRTFVKENVGYQVNFDSTKAQTELGIDFLPLAQTMQEMYQVLLDNDVVKPKEK